MAQTLSTMLELGTIAPDFDLPDTTGKRVRRDEHKGQPLLVMFICNHCPFVVHIRHELAQLGRDYQGRIGMVGINSNDVEKYPADGPEAMAREVEQAGYLFPYLFDPTQEVAKAYRAACTPDLYLFDSEHRLVYRGRLDGARPGNKVPVTGEDLRAALDAVLAGEAVSDEQLPSMGCNIKWKPGNAPAYFG